MADILLAIGSVFTATTGWFSSIAVLFTTTAILQLGIAMTVIGFVVGILHRLVRG